jgi:hypothetical protein
MDTYTKAVLTVIAISLAAIALENSGALPARAAAALIPLKVQICGQTTDDCAPVVDSALLVRAQ